MLIKNFKKMSVLIYLFFLPCTTIAQNSTEYLGILQEIYLGRQPSARSEALGRCGVAMVENIYSAFYNPAGLSFSDGLLLSGSYADPFYGLRDANYNFIGIGYNLKNYGTIGLSRFRFNYGELEYNGNMYRDFISMFILSYAFKPIKDLSLGMNINLVQNKSFGKSFYAHNIIYPVDIGILKIFQFSGKSEVRQKLFLGVSLFNINYAKIGYVTKEQKDALPVIFRLGASYQLSLYKEMFSSGLNTFSILFTLEYQDLFNSKYRTGLKAGTEVSFFEMFAFRLGYYRETLDDHGTSSNKDLLDDVTFGFGFQLPLETITEKKIPLNFKFDMTTLQQPSYSRLFDNWGNFTVYSLSVHWMI